MFRTSLASLLMKYTVEIKLFHSIVTKAVLHLLFATLILNILEPFSANEARGKTKKMFLKKRQDHVDNREGH